VSVTHDGHGGQICPIGKHVPPGREGQDLGRSGVEPLHVVHGEQDRTGSRQAAQRTKEPGRDGERLCRGGRLGPQHCGLKRLTLRNRQVAKDVRADPVHQIEKPSERVLCLRLIRAGRQHAKPALLGVMQASLPQGGLADARPTREQEHQGYGT
jgi:hypothetical protein